MPKYKCQCIFGQKTSELDILSLPKDRAFSLRPLVRFDQQSCYRIIGWFVLEGSLNIIHFLWAGTSSARPRCSKPYPNWPCTLPGMQHFQHVPNVQEQQQVQAHFKTPSRKARSSFLVQWLKPTYETRGSCFHHLINPQNVQTHMSVSISAGQNRQKMSLKGMLSYSPFGETV